MARSQRARLGKHAITDGVMDVLGDTDAVVKERVELLLEIDLVDEAASTLEGDEQVDVARRSRVSSRDQARDAAVRCAVTCRAMQDLVSYCSKERQVRRCARGDRCSVRARRPSHVGGWNTPWCSA